MKCIQYTDGSIKRVSDSIAEQTVKSGEAKFVSKSEWRKAGRKR